MRVFCRFVPLSFSIALAESSAGQFHLLTHADICPGKSACGKVFPMPWAPNPRLKVALRPLSFEPHPKAPRTFAECLLATLEDIAHRFANIGVFQATSNIGNRR